MRVDAPFLACALWLAGSSVADSAVIQLPGGIAVEGILDGGIIAPGVTGDTLDYLKFELMSTSELTVEVTNFSSNRMLMLAAFIGRNDEFGFLGNPYLIIGTIGPQSFSRPLDAGVYVAVVGTRANTSYDIFDGFVPVNPEGGGFTVGEYGYAVSGDVKALEFWDGELDGTFKITIIPEPATVALAGFGAVLLLPRRRAKSDHRP
jgi:hypothetical protein